MIYRVKVTEDTGGEYLLGYFTSLKSAISRVEKHSKVLIKDLRRFGIGNCVLVDVSKNEALVGDYHRAFFLMPTSEGRDLGRLNPLDDSFDDGLSQGTFTISSYPLNKALCVEADLQ